MPLSRRDLAGLALAAILVHGWCLGAVLLHPDRQMEEDSRGYLLLAANLAQDGRFGRPVRAGEDAPEIWRPELARTPGYPAIIASFERLTGRGRSATVLLQHTTSIVLCLAIAMICAHLWGRSAGLAAGLLLITDLQGLALGSMILTEGLYGVALFGCVWLTSSLIKRPSSATATAAGLLAGATALLRPTSIVLPLAMGAGVAAWGFARRTPRLITTAAILAVSGMLVVGAWTIRNGRVAGEYTLSTVARYNLLACHAAGALARASAVDDQMAIDRLCSQAGMTEQRLRYFPLTADENARVRNLAARTIMRYPMGFATDYALRTTNMAAGPEKQILTVLGIPWIGFSKGSQPAPAGAMRVAGIGLLAFQVAWLLAIYLLTLRGMARAWRGQEMPALWWMCAVAAAYVLALSSGSPGDPRMRWPTIPLLVVMAAAGMRRESSRR